MSKPPRSKRPARTRRTEPARSNRRSRASGTNRGRNTRSNPHAGPAVGRGPDSVYLPFIIVAAIVVLAVFAVVQIATPRAPKPQAEPEPTLPPVSAEGFDAGNIISDEVFFNPQAMTEKQVADFIAKWNKGCRTGAEGTACLAKYVEDSPSWGANEYCVKPFAGKKHDSAAAIIYKAAQACDVNPQALLVTLQKEQGLITASGTDLTPARYQIAMGYGCPDHTNCNPEDYGFARQVYGAARQFKMYRAHPQKYNVKAGQNNQIAYDVDPDCGFGVVYVQNQATAGLYNYTPYQPSPQALSGRGGKCTTWGNLNFYAFYKAWFNPQ